ncbi:hypothetical protein ACIGW8_01490 [Streptomyces sioyaensis]|uniref:hypothetical protein n=1 Tax=Streptomyces sioyaensis TaxID=67364 RepID=UPI0037CE9772
MVTVLGVDACPAGWLAVGLHDGRFADARVVTTLGRLLAGAAVDGAAVVAVNSAVRRALPVRSQRRTAGVEGAQCPRRTVPGFAEKAQRGSSAERTINEVAAAQRNRR